MGADALQVVFIENERIVLPDVWGCIAGENGT